MFSGGVMLGDLDDFISPSQACVNPLFTEAGKKAAAAPAAPSGDAPAEGGRRGAARIELESDFLLPPPGDAGVRPDLIKASGAGKAAQVSLNDCLACSGCVTSAETVLIQQQSTAEMLRALADPAYELFVVSFSHQALASLAAHYGERDGPLGAYRRLAGYFRRSLGFHYVCDTQPAGELGLAEACREFVGRLRANGVGGGGGGAAASRPPWAAAPASVAVSSTRLQYVTATSVGGVAVAAGAPVTVPEALPPAAAGGGDSVAPQAPSPQQPLPLLASACPGWVCYAEKTVPEALPYVSTVKSPQQATGALLKHVLSGGRLLPPGEHLRAALTGGAATAAPADAPAVPLSLTRGTASHPSRVYHVTVMPCFDKKLEASRKDFAWETDAPAGSGSGSDTGFREGVAGGSGDGAVAKEVDCVITPAELVELLTSRGVEWGGLPQESRRGYYPPPPPSDAAAAEGAASATAENVSDSGSEAPLDVERLFTGATSDGRHLVGPPLSAASAVSSDGWAEVLLRHAARELYRLELPAGAVARPVDDAAATAATSAPDGGIVWLPPGKNPDLREAALMLPAGTAEAAGGGEAAAAAAPATREALRIALAYGFRSIQTVVNRLKKAAGPAAGGGASSRRAAAALSGQPAWAYVEVMACPSGCANGGGQTKPAAPAAAVAAAPAAASAAPVNPLKAAAEAGRARVSEVSRQLLEDRYRPAWDPPASPVVRLIEAAVLHGRGSDSGVAPVAAGARALLLGTRYHTVPKLEAAAMKW